MSNVTDEHDYFFHCYPDDSLPLIVSTILTIIYVIGMINAACLGTKESMIKAKEKAKEKMQKQEEKNKIKKLKQKASQNEAATKQTKQTFQNWENKHENKNDSYKQTETDNQNVIKTNTQEEEKKRNNDTGVLESVFDNMDIDLIDKSSCSRRCKYNFYLIKYCMKKFPREFRSKLKCYFQLITHIIDQVTDIAVIVQFGQISYFELQHNFNCPYINGTYLFILSLFVFLFYRFISAIWIFRLTGHSYYQALTQFLFDMKLMDAIRVNYVNNRKEPSSPQRYIQVLEATIESFPQCAIQLYYFVKVRDSSNQSEYNSLTSTDIIVIISLIMSIINVTSKMVNEDKI